VRARSITSGRTSSEESAALEESLEMFEILSAISLPVVSKLGEVDFEFEK
jgi:hypothetical protein